MAATSRSPLGATEVLLDVTSRLRWDELDDRTRHEAVRHLLDTVGVMIAGASGDIADRAAAALAAARPPAGQVPVPGRAVRHDVLDAAFLGGTAAHGIELDDGYREGTTHPGVCVVPAALALAYQRALSGPVLLEAVVAGYEGVSAVARACHPRLRQRGFHPTGASGVFGSALAASRLLRLDRSATADALGVAASSAGGLFAFLSGGGDVKRLHAGQAARDGLLAALLADAGVQGPPAVIEGHDGFAQAFSDGLVRPLEAAPDGLWAIADCYIKPYPCCRHLQPAAEALFALHAEEGVRPDEIERIEVETYAIAAEHAHVDWDTFAGAQLSFPYIAALAARDGAITMASFDETTRRDPDLARLAATVHVDVDDELDASYPANRPARVTVHTPRGRFTREVIEALGSDKIPLDDRGLSAKFRMLVDPVLGAPRASALVDALWGIADCHDVKPVIEATALDS